MADKMYVIITAKKEVPDRETARAVYDLVKDRMSDRPDVDLHGHCTNHFDLDEE